MPTVQNLKRKLQVIQSTKKVTQAMKSASTVKYSKLNAMFSDFEKYESCCSELYNLYPQQFNAVFSENINEKAPVCYLILTSDKGMCGSFNTETLSFSEEQLKNTAEDYVVYVCGRKAQEYFSLKKLDFQEAFEFSDIPDVEGARLILNKLLSLLKNGRISSVKIIYPQYFNMIKQKPACIELMSLHKKGSDDQDLITFVPDKQTVIACSAEKILLSRLYRAILETALGAQAATLTTMRSAYDTACEYSTQLESEINRKRQSQVTADVLEISAEFAIDREELI